MYSVRDKQRAQALLDADFAADLISAEKYGAEEAQINAGSSRSSYLKQVTQSLHGRAFAGDHEAIATLAFRYAIVFVLVVVLLIVGCGVLQATTTTFDGGIPEVSD